MYARTVFGCGVDKQLFQDRYEALDEEEQQRLERVARRVWITLKLRYETFTFSDPFQASEERYYLEMVEMPAIEIYLLVSCLDTLAGQPIHVQFKEWLNKKPEVKSLSFEEIIALHDEYMNEHGSNRNMKKLFKNFPQSFRTWLTTNIVIYEENKSLSEADRDPELLVERLLRYFYGLRRNEFTHSSYARQVSKSKDIELPEVNSWWFTPASGTLITLDRGKKSRRWYFSYKEGLDEATILRLIIHIVVLQIIGLEVTEELINLSLNNYSRIHALYFFMSEVVGNSHMLEWWQNAEQLSKVDLPYSIIFSGIPPLRKEFSLNMIDRFKPEIEWENGFQAMTRQYATEVDQLNVMIDDFNIQNPPVQPKQGNLEERWTVIKDFLHSQTKASAYKKILHWPTRPEMTNLWLIIRDPCYTS